MKAMSAKKIYFILLVLTMLMLVATGAVIQQGTV